MIGNNAFFVGLVAFAVMLLLPGTRSVQEGILRECAFDTIDLFDRFLPILNEINALVSSGGDCLGYGNACSFAYYGEGKETFRVECEDGGNGTYLEIERESAGEESTALVVGCLEESSFAAFQKPQVFEFVDAPICLAKSCNRESSNFTVLLYELYADLYAEHQINAAYRGNRQCGVRFLPEKEASSGGRNKRASSIAASFFWTVAITGVGLISSLL